MCVVTGEVLNTWIRISVSGLIFGVPELEYREAFNTSSGSRLL